MGFSRKRAILARARVEKEQWRLKEMEVDGALCGSMELMQPKVAAVVHWTLAEEVPIRVVTLLMNYMCVVRETNNPLPYAIIIPNILEHFGISTRGESKITLNVSDRKINVDVIHKMGFFQELTDRIYKHRSNKQAAPVDPTANVFVNPLEHQPSDFHTKSSSSASMPSNQIIMDDLFSLRGYISNQMDALDAQNQQIQIELQLLSYKINKMDLDEDSSEPES
ncbi:hypothetical protein Lal_00031976 [Lupinus albus]|nr:hypothetical protein Lal_00031976 [Lupinus albus]